MMTENRWEGQCETQTVLDDSPACCHHNAHSRNQISKSEEAEVYLLSCGRLCKSPPSSGDATDHHRLIGLKGSLRRWRKRRRAGTSSAGSVEADCVRDIKAAIADPRWSPSLNLAGQLPTPEPGGRERRGT